jgi:hypothetical protein
VTISDTTAGATIYYTTNGTTPTTSSTKYTGAITVSATETVKAIAVATNYSNSAMATATYTIGAATTLPAPTFSPAAGTYSTTQTVTISDATAGTTIYYTTNGTTPTTSSTKYTGAITVSSTETITAIAVETGYTNSPAATATFTISAATTLPAPTFSPAAGTYATAQTVTISDATAGTTIYYTTNGTTPTTSSTKYTGAITVSATETITAIAVETGYTNSPAATATFTISAATTLPAPTFSPAAGTYATAQTVTISDATAGTTIYYVINGNVLTAPTKVYSGPIKVSTTETLEAIAVKSGSTNSPAATATYTISSATALPAPTFSPAAGTYWRSQTVTISDAKAGTTIYYTTDGTEPTTSSTLYSGPVTVDSTKTLEAIAVETGFANSPAATAAYIISPDPDFDISLSPNSLSFTKGHFGTSKITVTPLNGSNQAVSFGCGELPAGLLCTFSSATVTTGGQPVAATLTVTDSTSTAVNREMSPLIPITVAGIFFGAIGFRRRRKIFSGLFLVGLALGFIALSGCGGIQATQAVTPAASTITVTATAGTIQHAAPLTVTVN